MYPVDTGYNYKDSGKLVGLGAHEAVVSTTSKEGGKEVRIHYPRWNFEIGKATSPKAEGGRDAQRMAREERGSFSATDHIG